MGRSRSLTLEQRNRVQGMLEAGMSVTAAARRIGVHHSTVSRLKSRLVATGSLRDRQRSGRPRVTTAADDRYILLTSRRNRFMTAKKIANQLQAATRTRVSDQTIRRRLHARMLRARKPYVGVPLTQRHRQARLNWATIHRRWTQRQWNNVLFTDESRFNLETSDGRQRVWRRRGERYDVQNVVQRDRYGGGSIMVWGGIGRNGKTDLITVRGTLTADRYCAQIVQPVIVPYTRQRPGLIVQQDNARPHTARLTMNMFNANNIQLLDWPARSPDLNPIEHMWDILGRRVQERVNVRNVRDLEQALHAEWLNIPMRDVHRLVSSMRRRCTAVMTANGGHTPY